MPAGIWLAETTQCGHQPVLANDFGAANTYELPGDRLYFHLLGVFPLFLSRYFGSEGEAQAHGYRHAPIP